MESRSTTGSRRSVRILEPRVNWRAAGVTLALSGGVGAVFLLVWWWGGSTDAELRAIHHRTLADVELDWRCEGGHAFRDRGQVNPRACPFPACGRVAHPAAIFLCPSHGTMEVAARFGRTPEGVERAVQYRWQGRDWTDAALGVRCPKCGREMTRKPPDLLPPSGKGKDRAP